MIDTTPWVMTPESRDECGSMIESFHDNGHMCAMMLMNYLAAQIESMKEQSNEPRTVINEEWTSNKAISIFSEIHRYKVHSILLHQNI